MSRKLEEKQARRLAEERRKAEQRRAARRRNLVTIAIALLVLGSVVALIVAERGGGQGPIGVPAARADCTEAETPDIEGRDHIQDGTRVQYATSPPTSGPHYAQPADDGFYSSAIEPERLVHNLEHGQVVIWYRPDAADDIRDGIERYIDETKQSFAVLASPYEGIQGDFNYVMTAWGATQSCENMSSEAIDRFRRRFQGHGPEQATPPFS